MQIDGVRFRPRPLSLDRAGYRRIVGVGKAFVSLRKAAPAFAINAPPLVCITGMETDSAQQIFVVHVRAMIAEVERAGHARDREALLRFVAQSHIAAEVPLVHVRILSAQVFVQESLERSRRRRRRILAMRIGNGRQSECARKKFSGREFDHDSRQFLSEFIMRDSTRVLHGGAGKAGLICPTWRDGSLRALPGTQSGARATLNNPDAPRRPCARAGAGSGRAESLPPPPPVHWSCTRYDPRGTAPHRHRGSPLGP